MKKIPAFVLLRHTNGDEQHQKDTVVQVHEGQFASLAGVGLIRKPTAKELAAAGKAEPAE